MSGKIDKGTNLGLEGIYKNILHQWHDTGSGDEKPRIYLEHRVGSELVQVYLQALMNDHSGYVVAEPASRDNNMPAEDVGLCSQDSHQHFEVVQPSKGILAGGLVLEDQA